MLASTSQPHKINSFYTSPGEAHCIQIGRKPKEQRRLNADIIETTRNSVLPSSEINSGSRETPVCKISKLLQMLQNVARCCKVEYLSKMKYENRETTTIEIGVVDYPKREKVYFSKFYAMLQTPRFLQLLQKPVTYPPPPAPRWRRPWLGTCRVNQLSFVKTPPAHADNTTYRKNELYFVKTRFVRQHQRKSLFTPRSAKISTNQ